MEIFVLILLGLVQGATEFLPVSSSGHLVLLGNLFGIENSLFVSIILHLATLFSILVMLRKEVFTLVRHPLSRQTMLLATATIPTCLIVLVIMPLVDKAFGGAFLGVCFLVTAIVLMLAERLSKKQAKVQELNFKQAFIMGVAQGLAVFPGISRSGSTISAGLVSGADRESTAKFSFLMSIPIILLSLVLEIYKICTTGKQIEVNIVGLILAFVCAFVVGILAIKWMLNLTSKANFRWFSLYLVVIAILSMFL